VVAGVEGHDVVAVFEDGGDALPALAAVGEAMREYDGRSVAAAVVVNSHAG
jgi:hypothetical protein